ncbi:MAG TPA: hypothetical protein VLQ79_04065, partial [Myxococcaceae bacterium]|nr:hypothetical protein [Myxococcaceae bacterium]
SAAATALGQLAQAHPEDGFFQLAALAGPDPETAPVGTEQLGKLEAVVRGGALRLPGALLRETLSKHLSPDDFRDFGLSTAVEVVLDVDLERYLERVLGQPGEADRRISVVRTVAGELARSGWLVELFSGARILSAVAERTRTEEDRALAASTLARAQRLWSGWTIFPRMGRWPASALANELRARGFEDEVGVLEHYAALGAE